MSKIKILCISDATDALIYSTNAPVRYADVDFVISAGDLPLRYYDYIQTILKKDVYYVYGNHNLEGFRAQMKGRTTVGNTFTYQSPVTYDGFFLDGKIVYLKKYDLLIGGLGGSMHYNGGDSQYTESQMSARMIRMVPRLIYNKMRYGRYLDILITHAPPYKIGDGEDLCHKGFSSFLRFMEKVRPSYLLHGHVHLIDMNDKRETKYEDTTVINVYKNYILEIER